jgi:membrane fusion protein (multidrug efflux system)
MRFSRRALSVLTVAIVLTLLTGGVYWRLRPAAGGGAQAQTPAGAKAPSGDAAAQVSSVVSSAFSTDVPQPVSGARVVRDTLWISVAAAGRAEAVSRATVQAQVAGVVEAVPVRENAAVKTGELLLRVDSTEYALALARAESDLRRARADYQQTVLFDDRITDARIKAQRDSIARSRSGLDAAEVAVKTARLQLDRSHVTSPFPGRIADVKVVAGQDVSAGAELMTVVNLDPIKVEANVLEAEMGLLSEGRRATVRFAAFPGETFAGRIETVNPVVDPEKRTGRVTVVLDNPGGRIKPGMYAEVSLAATSFADRLLVPRAAILERGDGRRRTMLFVYQEEGGVGRAKWRYVTTGRENDSLVEIVPSEEGTVEPGEIVLVDGHHYLAHDTPVRLVDDVEKAGGRPGR